jgi:hypothetical protein
MSNALFVVGTLMVFIGLFIMFAGLEEAAIIAFQIVILGAIFFGLGIVVISIGVLNNSIKKINTHP